MQRRVIRNTYPQCPNVPHAAPGDVCEYIPRRDGGFNLHRVTDRRVVFSSPDRRPDSPEPRITGVIAEVKKHGWVFEVEALEREAT